MDIQGTRLDAAGTYGSAAGIEQNGNVRAAEERIRAGRDASDPARAVRKNQEPNKGEQAEAVNPGKTLDDRAAFELVDKIKEFMKSRSVELKFKLHEDTGDLQVEVLDSRNEKVIREIPPDELFRLSEFLEETAKKDHPGSFFDRVF